MFYHPHLLLLIPICDVVSSLLLRDQDRDILFLRQQLLIMHRQLGREAAYGRLEQLALLFAALRLSKRRLAAALLIVQPSSACLPSHHSIPEYAYLYEPTRETEMSLGAELVGLVRAPCARSSFPPRKWSKSEYQFGTTSVFVGCLNVPSGCQPCCKISELAQLTWSTKQMVRCSNHPSLPSFQRLSPSDRLERVLLPSTSTPQQFSVELGEFMDFSSR